MNITCTFTVGAFRFILTTKLLEKQSSNLSHLVSDKTFLTRNPALYRRRHFHNIKQNYKTQQPQPNVQPDHFNGIYIQIWPNKFSL